MSRMGKCWFACALYANVALILLIVALLCKPAFAAGITLVSTEYLTTGGRSYTLCRYSDGVSVTLNGIVICPQRW